MFSARLLKISLPIVLLVLPLETKAQDFRAKTKIGAILPLSGDAASIGISVRQGMELALEELSAAGKSAVSVVFEDDRLDPKNTISAFDHLTAQPSVDVVLNLSSGTGNAISPLAEKKRIPLVVAAAADPNIVKDKDWVMLFSMSPEEEIATLLKEVKRRRIKRIARIDAQQAGLMELKRVFDSMSEGMVEVAMTEEVPVDARLDLRSYIARVAARKDLDAMMVNLMPGQLSSFCRQLRQLGVALPIFGLEIYDDVNEIKAAAGTFEGVWFVNQADPNADLLKRLKSRFPGSNPSWAAYGYDFVNLIDVAEHVPAEATRAQTLRAYLHSIDGYRGTMGLYSSTADKRIKVPAVVKRIENGVVEQLER